MGVKIIIYIDDMLILAEKSEQAFQHLETLLWTLQSLGFIINQEKSVFMPAQEIEFQWLVTNSQAMELRQIKREATKLLTQKLVSVRVLFQFIEKLSADTQAVAPAPLFYCHLQGNLKVPCLGYKNMGTLSQEVQEELTWWQQHLLVWNSGACSRVENR